MPTILVVTGSVRPNSVNQKIVPLVTAEVAKQGAEVVVADLGELAMPFFDSPYTPMMDEFNPTNESVKRWTQMVTDADGVIFVTPEYNHTMTPVQMNAIDWIGKEWEGKRVGLVGYGWQSGAHQAHATAREALAGPLKAIVGDEQTNLFFSRELSPEGDVVETEKVQGQIEATVAELIRGITA